MSAPISTDDAEHYIWGGNCDGWHLVRAPELSVIQERMPPGATDLPHKHSHARQFFFVLDGEAIFEVENVEHRISAQQGLEIAPGRMHRILNRSAEDLHFLLISQPPSHGDRVLAAE